MRLDPQKYKVINYKTGQAVYFSSLRGATNHAKKPTAGTMTRCAIVRRHDPNSPYLMHGEVCAGIA